MPTTVLQPDPAASKDVQIASGIFAGVAFGGTTASFTCGTFTASGGGVFRVLIEMDLRGLDPTSGLPPSAFARVSQASLGLQITSKSLTPPAVIVSRSRLASLAPATSTWTNTNGGDPDLTTDINIGQPAVGSTNDAITTLVQDAIDARLDKLIIVLRLADEATLDGSSYIIVSGNNTTPSWRPSVSMTWTPSTQLQHAAAIYLMDGALPLADKGLRGNDLVEINAPVHGADGIAFTGVAHPNQQYLRQSSTSNSRDFAPHADGGWHLMVRARSDATGGAVLRDLAGIYDTAGFETFHFADGLLDAGVEVPLVAVRQTDGDAQAEWMSTFNPTAPTDTMFHVYECGFDPTTSEIYAARDGIERRKVVTQSFPLHPSDFTVASLFRPATDELGAQPWNGAMSYLVVLPFAPTTAQRNFLRNGGAAGRTFAELQAFSPTGDRSRSRDAFVRGVL